MDLRTDQITEREPVAAIGISRTVQLCIAVGSLVVALVPALVTAGLIWLTLGRPILFSQTRSGLGGRPFKIYKFRTMHDRRDENGKLLPDAQRQTALTQFLRAARLDEIPQLIAIIMGDLNFIGPRPLQPATLTAFGKAGAVRGQVRPGLSGWAQVNGNTRLGDTDKLALDIWYIDNRSIALDVRILMLTVRTILFGELVNQKNLAEAVAHLRQRMGTALQPDPAPSRVPS